ncbi:MAG: helix-turn-helix transcriptional regulator [Bauldia sp.]|nr:helix-turn-helix transcriptional regulator [Bauldia sp.]
MGHYSGTSGKVGAAPQCRQEGTFAVMKTTTDPRFTRAVVLQQFVEPFRRRGGDIGKVLQKNAIPLEALDDPNHLIVASALYSALEDMAVALGDSYFCANLARDAALRGVPTLRESATRATSLDDFLVGAVLETGRQFDNIVYALNVTHEAAVFSIRRTRRVERPTPQADAVLVVFYVALFRSGLGKVFDPRRILVSAPSFEAVPPGFLPAQSMVLSPSVALSIAFPPEWLVARFSPRWLVSDPREHVAGPPDQEDVPLASIREFIRDNLANEAFDLARLALVCGSSRRRIQRIFAAHGLTFRSVRDDIRRGVAVDLVTHTDVPLKDVAWQCGLSSEAAFSRSYRRWTGEAPRAHRLRIGSGR